ncbi:MAG: ABC transporter ATP-binding protein [Candidatus Dormibacteria bacterium]
MSVAIRADGISKTFRIPVDRAATLKYRVTHPRSSSKYRRFEALHDVSFGVDEGEFLGIIGHNGCGKSTLLKILAGIYQPTSGRVEVVGRVSPFLELGVGFNPELTARENVFLSGSVLGLTRHELEGRVDEIIAFAEIEEFAEAKLKNFSSGMQVRLAFSVAIQADAQVLLMDEVLAVGDAAFAEKCFDVFARYKREGRTIVLVTHDLGAVQNYCDRCLLIDHGRLVMDGSAADVTARYRRGVGHLQGDEPAGIIGSAGDARPDDMSRWGAREIAITGVRLLGSSGEDLAELQTGAATTVEVGFVVNDDNAGAFVCTLGFERVDGLNVAAPSSASSGQVMACPPAGTTGTVQYSIPALPFVAGRYYLSAALYDRHSGHAFDHIQRLREVRVTDGQGREGLVDPGGRWEFAIANIGEPRAATGTAG